MQGLRYSVIYSIYYCSSSTIEHFLVDEDFNPFLDHIYTYIYIYILEYSSLIEHSGRTELPHLWEARGDL